MGAGSSQPLPVLPSNNFMSICLTGFDTITVLYGGQPEIDAVHSAVTQFWFQGVQSMKAVINDPNNPNAASQCYKFTLKGRPFHMAGDKMGSIQSRKMAANILFTMYNLGWKLLVSSELSRKNELTTWIFQRQMLNPNTNIYFTIGICEKDKLQINDCPANLHSVIKNVCTTFWSRGIQDETMIAPSTYEIKFNGNPWVIASKNESCDARLMLRQIIQTLSGMQWLLYANFNLKSPADTLFFQYNPSIQGEIEFLTVSLNNNDRLRFLQMPDSIISALEETVRQCWFKGIQEINDDRPKCYELKLKGTPWWTMGNEAVASRLLIVKIMERLSSLGYFVTTGIDVIDKSLLLFQRGAPMSSPFMCLSLNEMDTIQMINAPQNVVEAGRALINRYWVLGVQEKKQLYDGVSYEAKLNGNPWESVYNSDGLHGRALLLGLLNSFISMGWHLACSADISAKHVLTSKQQSYAFDVHNWYFMYDESTLMQQQQPPQQNLSSTKSDAAPSYDQAIGFT